MRAYFIHPGFRFTFWYRLCQFLLTRPTLKLFLKLARLKYLRVQLLTGIQIPILADIDAGLYIPHPGGIVVNPGFYAGRGLYLSHNVTVGKVHSGERAGVPKVGEDVYIGPGAVLLGNVKIGDNVAVGANSVVIHDLADDSFAVGAPAKVVSTEGGALLLLGEAALRK
ncbi:MAG: serine acetyltransferase [Opitutae bacterium]|nr:serine acetyltransferase [Opitutae bacterium]